MMKTRYVRVYADADGESHFSDEEMELRFGEFRATGPAPPPFPGSLRPHNLLCSPALLAGSATGTQPPTGSSSSVCAGRSKFE